MFSRIAMYFWGVETLLLLFVITVHSSGVFSYSITGNVIYNGTIRGQSIAGNVELYSIKSRTQCGNLCTRHSCHGYSLIEGDDDVTCALTTDELLLPEDVWETFIIQTLNYEGAPPISVPTISNPGKFIH